MVWVEPAAAVAGQRLRCLADLGDREPAAAVAGQQQESVHRAASAVVVAAGVKIKESVRLVVSVAVVAAPVEISVLALELSVAVVVVGRRVGVLSGLLRPGGSSSSLRRATDGDLGTSPQQHRA